MLTYLILVADARKQQAVRMAGRAAGWPPDSSFLFIILNIVHNVSAFLQYKTADMPPGCLCTLSVNQHLANS